MERKLTSPQYPRHYIAPAPPSPSHFGQDCQDDQDDHDDYDDRDEDDHDDEVFSANYILPAPPSPSRCGPSLSETCTSSAIEPAMVQRVICEKGQNIKLLRNAYFC